jgi:hypothetical protein
MLAVLKPDIHRRTLVTSGDSSKLGIWDLSPIDEERRIKSTDGLQYMEAQVLGPLDLSHVEAIYVNRGNEAAMNQLDLLINLCGDFNIKLYLYTPGGDLLTHMAQVSSVQSVTSKAIRKRKAHHGKQVSVGARFEGIEVDSEEIRRGRERNRQIFERLISSASSDARPGDREVINVLRRIILTSETSHRSKQRAVDLYRKTKMSDPFLEYFLGGVQPEKSADYNDLKKLSTREIRTLRNLNYPFVKSELQLLQEERNLSSWSFEVPSESPLSPRNFNVRDFLTALKILMETNEKIPPQTMRSFFQYASISIIRRSEMVLNEVQLRFIAKAWFIATFRTEGIQSDDLPDLFARQPEAKEIFREEFVLQLKSLSVHQSRDFIRRAFDAYLHLQAISFTSHELGQVQAEKFIELVRSQPSRWNFNMAFALLPFETYLRLTVETLSGLPFHQISKENLKLFVVEVGRAFDQDMKFLEPVLENIKDKLLEWLSLQKENRHTTEINPEVVRTLIFEVSKKADLTTLRKWMSSRQFIESLTLNDGKSLRRKLARQKSCLHVF